MLASKLAVIISSFLLNMLAAVCALIARCNQPFLLQVEASMGALRSHQPQLRMWQEELRWRTSVEQHAPRADWAGSCFALITSFFECNAHASPHTDTTVSHMQWVVQEMLLQGLLEICLGFTAYLASSAAGTAFAAAAGSQQMLAVLPMWRAAAPPRLTTAAPMSSRAGECASNKWWRPLEDSESS